MIDKDLARRAAFQLIFEGTDITNDIMPYLTSVTYTDSEEDESDDLNIVLQDRDNTWLYSWLEEIMSSAAGNRKIRARFIRQNWHNNGEEEYLDAGEFDLDSVSVKEPPMTATLKASSISYKSEVKQTSACKTWRSYNLHGIASEVASKNGMNVMFLSSVNPSYAMKEQYWESDIAFLSRLCHDAGISLKVTDNTLVLFAQQEYESKPALLTITRGDQSYLSWSGNTEESETGYSSAVVKYVDPRGQLLEGSADNPDAKNGQVLNVTATVQSRGEAEALASKMLRLSNKFQRTATFSMVGNPYIVAGVTINLEGFGAWSGKYIVKQAVHSASSSGYTTQATLRPCLEGY